MITRLFAFVLALLVSFSAVAESPTVTVGPPLDGVRTLSAMSEHRRGRAKAKVIIGAVMLGYGVFAGALGLGLGLGKDLSNGSDFPVYNIMLLAYAGFELGVGTIVGSTLLGVGMHELARERPTAQAAPLFSVSF